MKKSLIYLFISLLFCGLSNPVTAGDAATLPAAHNYHTSLTRIDYNAKEKLAEITIRLFTHDLVPVLEKRTGRRIDLEKMAEIDKILIEYLSQNFILKVKTGEAQKLVWVGKELENGAIYIYLQIPLAQGLEETSLQNTIFFESFSEQTNLVVSRFNKKKSDLLFVSGDKFKKLSFA